MHLNDELAVFESGLKRGPTRKDTYVDKVDISQYLHDGTNTISALVCYYGVPETIAENKTSKSKSYNPSGKGGFLFEAEADGQTIIADGNWKATIHTARG